MNNFQKKPLVTYSLIIVDLLVFSGMSLSGGTQNIANLIAWGAKYDPLIVQGELWRLVTPMFIHIGYEHLGLNLLTLYFLGIQLEQLFGKWRFLLLYLVSGIGGNILSFAFSPNVSAGASTAIFGLLGAYLMLGESFRDDPELKASSQRFLLLVVLNLVIAPLAGGVDIWGHIGGLFAGFLLGYVVGLPHIHISKAKRIIGVVALVVVYGLLLQIGFENWA